MGSKINVNFDRRFLIIRAPAAAGARKIKIWMGCIWPSFFLRFWLIFVAMLGGKIEHQLIKNSIGKTIEKRRAARWPTRRSKSLRELRDRGGRTQGEVPPFKAGQTLGVRGEVRLASPGRPDWPSRPDLT